MGHTISYEVLASTAHSCPLRFAVSWILIGHSPRIALRTVSLSLWWMRRNTFILEWVGPLIDLVRTLLPPCLSTRPMLLYASLQSSHWLVGSSIWDRYQLLYSQLRSKLCYDSPQSRKHPVSGGECCLNKSVIHSEKPTESTYSDRASTSHKPWAFANRLLQQRSTENRIHSARNRFLASSLSASQQCFHSHPLWINVQHYWCHFCKNMCHHRFHFVPSNDFSSFSSTSNAKTLPRCIVNVPMLT